MMPPLCSASSTRAPLRALAALALATGLGALPLAAAAPTPPPAAGSPAAAPAAAGLPRTVTFTPEQQEFKWTLAELDPALPADWRPYNYLVLELKASSPQRFYLSLPSGQLNQRREVHPLPGVWIRAAIPLSYYRSPNRSGTDLASISKTPRNSFWLSTGGAYGPLDAVKGLGVRMFDPAGNPTLSIRSLRLTQDDPGSDILDGGKPVVDVFGQWIHDTWPGKAADEAALRRAWAEEEKALAPADPTAGRFGGYAGPTRKATGFFRVEEIEGRWWFIDPEGRQFFSTAVTGIGTGAGEARTKGREDYFAALPPREVAGLGRGSQGGFYAWNLVRRHGADIYPRWIDVTARRLDAWGLNTIGNWSNSRLWDAGRKAYQVHLGGWGMSKGYLGLPDVFADEFVQTAERDAATQCAPRRNDPWLLGYFVGNEPPWTGRESLIVDMILEKPGTPIHREAKAWLAAGDTPERRRAFIYRAYEKFLEVTIAAIRRHDPNHLILGFRFGGHKMPIEMLRACRVFDVYSLNVYERQISPKMLDEIYAATGRPIIIGEFHFGVPGRGLAPGLVQVKDQAERGVAYRYYVEQAAAHPALIGTSWFQWVDQPSTGRFDGENYNIGLVDVTDRPYPELIAAMQATHARVRAVHEGKEAPFAQKPVAR